MVRFIGMQVGCIAFLEAVTAWLGISENGNEVLNGE